MTTQAKKGGVQQVQGQLELPNEIQLRKRERNIQCVLLRKNEPSELLNGLSLSSPPQTDPTHTSWYSLHSNATMLSAFLLGKIHRVSGLDG